MAELIGKTAVTRVVAAIFFLQKFNNSKSNIMIIKVDRRGLVPVVAREMLLVSGEAKIDEEFLVFDVEEFPIFLHIVYSAFAKLSRVSEDGGYSASVYMRLPVVAEVRGHRFACRVDGNAIRYGEL